LWWIILDKEQKFYMSYIDEISVMSEMYILAFHQGVHYSLEMLSRLGTGCSITTLGQT